MILSYSGLSTFIQCPTKFKLTYIDNKRSKQTSLALELGTLCHECMEDKLGGKEGYINKFIENFDKLKQKYGDEADKYAEKYQVFLNRLQEAENTEYTPVFVEKEFMLDFKNGYKIRGFIDLVLKDSNGEFVVVDYKTNKDLYKPKDLDNSLQLGIYALAVEKIYGKLPVKTMYDMLFYGHVQENKFDKTKLLKKIDSILDGIDYCKKGDLWERNEGILCYWCPYFGNGISFDFDTSGLCECTGHISIDKWKIKNGVK